MNDKNGNDKKIENTRETVRPKIMYGIEKIVTDDKVRVVITAGLAEYYKINFETKECLVEIINKTKHYLPQFLGGPYETASIMISPYEKKVEEENLGLDYKNPKRIKHFSSRELLCIEEHARISLYSLLGNNFANLEARRLGNGNSVIIELDTRKKKK